MRFRGIATTALAALALSGLFASVASAEETGEGSSAHPGQASLMVCDSTPTGTDECASRIWGSPDEINALSHRVAHCLESHPELHGTGRPFAEKCVAAAQSGGDANTSGHARHAKRGHRGKHAAKH